MLAEHRKDSSLEAMLSLASVSKKIAELGVVKKKKKEDAFLARMTDVQAHAHASAQNTRKRREKEKKRGKRGGTSLPP